jgi:hypothetical protein
MTQFPPERDWKLLRKLHPVALDRYCQRVLTEIAAIPGDAGRSHHQRYLAIYKLVERRDREMAATFDDMRRSTALFRILAIRRLNLLTEEEFAQFTDTMCEEVARLLKPLRKDSRALAKKNCGQQFRGHNTYFVESLCRSRHGWGMSQLVLCPLNFPGISPLRLSPVSL